MARSVLSKSNPAQAADLKPELVPCPEIGVDVLVWQLNGTAMAKYRRGGFNLRGNKLVPNVDYLTDSSYLLAEAIRDENNERVYEDSERGIISSWPNDVLERLAEVARRLNKLNDGDDEELEGNSEPEMTSGSTSI